MTSRRKIRPRRSVLFMPGSNLRAMNKARTLPADALVFDLEDAVSPGAKPDARERIAAVIGEGGFGARERIVRVNAMESPWGRADLEAAASIKPDAVLLPKVFAAEQIRAALAVLDAAGGGEIPLWIMIETPAGVMNAGPLAAASQRLDCLVLGTSDLSTEMRVPGDDNRLGLLAPLSWCISAARAAGLDVLDGVHLDISDANGLRRLCIQGRQLGFDGKTLIHPDQIAIANEVFGPGDDELETAREILDAWDRAVLAGKGVTVVRGRLVENLHAAEARRILELHEAIQALNQAP